jgi:hypothetical protein
MKKPNPTEQEVTGEQLIEYMSKIHCEALGEGVVACQGCGSSLSEGSAVVAYAFRPVTDPTYQFGYVKSAEGRPTPSECFTLGVRELIVQGRVGVCSDQAMQSSWPVLLAPEVLGLSPADSKSLQWLSDEERPSCVAVSDRRASTHVTDLGERDGPPSLVDRVIQARIEETCEALQVSDATCGGDR